MRIIQREKSKYFSKILQKVEKSANISDNATRRENQYGAKPMISEGF